MRLVTGLLVVSALIVPVSSWGKTTAPSKVAVQQLLQQRDDARHSGDWAAYAQFFTPDATVMNSDGASYKGRAQIQKNTADSWSGGAYKGAQMQTTVDSVQSIAPNVAVADATFEITNIAGGGSRKGKITVVLVNGKGGWKIAASRSMVPTPAGATRTSP
jgi:uncharacterized protein (TIGR02246 family)